MVAGPGLEPGLRGYEPRELPLLNPAIKFYLFLTIDSILRIIRNLGFQYYRVSYN
jgi:hypothetical protein